MFRRRIDGHPTLSVAELAVNHAPSMRPGTSFPNQPALLLCIFDRLANMLIWMHGQESPMVALRYTILFYRWICNFLRIRPIRPGFDIDLQWPAERMDLVARLRSCQLYRYLSPGLALILVDSGLAANLSRLNFSMPLGRRPLCHFCGSATQGPRARARNHDRRW